MKLGTMLLVAAMALAVDFATPRAVKAQTATTITYPSDNVAGTAISGRRPGLRTSAGIGTVVARQSKILYGHDGAAPQERPASDLRTTLLVDALQQLFTTLKDLFTGGLLSGLTGSTSTTTTTGG